MEECAQEAGVLWFWSFDTAALAKILGLDDSALKDNNHYPYDLAHYKNGMTFDLSWYSEPKEEKSGKKKRWYMVYR